MTYLIHDREKSQPPHPDQRGAAEVRHRRISGVLQPRASPRGAWREDDKAATEGRGRRVRHVHAPRRIPQVIPPRDEKGSIGTLTNANQKGRTCVIYLQLKSNHLLKMFLLSSVTVLTYPMG